MTQLPKLEQESIHETLRILVPGYFALFLVFTLFPELFDGQRGIALALVGGFGLGIGLYGMNLQDFLPVFKPRFGRMLRSYEKKKVEYMLRIVNALGLEDSKKKTYDLGQSNGFISQFWNNFSYTEISENVRARQRIHASLFYLYANCSLIMIAFLSFLVIAILSPNFTEFVRYHTNVSYDSARILIAVVFAALFWRKARDELKGSMMFQNVAMYWYREKLYERLTGIVNLRDKVEKRKND
jgi:hypothetical protein